MQNNCNSKQTETYSPTTHTIHYLHVSNYTSSKLLYLLWGHEATRIYKLQKKAIRTISMSKYNAHTEPIFKKLQFLKLNDIFKLQQLKFYYKLIKGDLPKYFQHFSYIHNFEIHHHYTRKTSSIFIPRVNHAYAQKDIRHNLIQTINNTPNIISLIKHIHSLRGFLNYIFFKSLYFL